MRQLVTMFAAVLFLATAPLLAQHLGARQQWQPEISATDARLQQPLTIEILGRAAVPALKLLSEATGVALTVAPENLTTIGERKFTIISKGLTLKAIMVQLPEALQECHWDIDASGAEPIYLLHRNGSVEAMVKKQRAERQAQRLAQYKAERAAARLSRLEVAAQALQMSPSELARIEETDLLLARWAQMPVTHEMMECLFTLPDQDMVQFLETGQLEYRHEDAPPEVQRLPELALELLHQYVAWIESWPPGEQHSSGLTAAQMRAELEEQTREIEQSSDFTITLSDYSGGILARAGGFAFPIVPEADRDIGELPGSLGHFLLAQTGCDYAPAREFLETWLEDRQEALERDHYRAWEKDLGAEPTDPRLLHSISLPGEGEGVAVLDLQQAIAAQTGLSVLSDCFTRGGLGTVSTKYLQNQMPLWHILTYLTYWRLDWSLTGDCLVFHRKHWYDYCAREAAADRRAAGVTAPQRLAE